MCMSVQVHCVQVCMCVRCCQDSPTTMNCVLSCELKQTLPPLNCFIQDSLSQQQEKKPRSGPRAASCIWVPWEICPIVAYSSGQL